MKYLEEVEAGVDVLKDELSKKLREENVPLEQRKRIIANLVQLNSEQDPAWECIQISNDRLLRSLDQLRDKHLALDRKTSTLPKPFEKSSLFPLANEDTDLASTPEAINFVNSITEYLALEFPDFWKMGQAYFKGK